jgi:hypothetical protein
MQYEPPLTAEERAELARIRASRAAKNARREIEDAHHWDGAVKGFLGIAAILFGLVWPEAFFHKEPVQGHFTLTTTGWIVEIIWLAIVATVALLIWRAHIKAKASRNPA